MAKPIIKWAGGKTNAWEEIVKWLSDKLRNGEINRYVEPFVGGGGLLLKMLENYTFDEIYINDVNPEITLMFRILKKSVDELIDELYKYQKEYLKLIDLNKKEDFYYYIREQFNDERKEINYTDISQYNIEHTAKFIFLNKTCFNGLFRVNKKGKFNVPFGKHKKPCICDEENIRELSGIMENIQIINGDFEDLTKFIDGKTFVYMDPPYRPIRETSSFTGYDKNGFDDSDQTRLANWYKKLNEEKDALLMQSNSDTANMDTDDEFFQKLYKEFRIEKITAKRFINCKGNGRKPITELLIMNY